MMRPQNILRTSTADAYVRALVLTAIALAVALSLRPFGGDDSATAHGRGAGIGLGLTIARAAAEAQGGSLWAEQRLQGGARFVLRLSCTIDASRAV